MSDIRITQRTEQSTAGVRAQVPMAELTDFFGRAFGETMAALQAQGLHPVGPPFGKYYGMPGETVDVEAGFPVSAPFAAAGDVVPGSLPGGRTAEATHVGPYDTMESTYATVQQYFVDEKLTPGSVMWESYLSDPDAEPDPSGWRTQICWPIA